MIGNTANFNFSRDVVSISILIKMPAVLVLFKCDFIRCVKCILSELLNYQKKKKFSPHYPNIIIKIPDNFFIMKLTNLSIWR